MRLVSVNLLWLFIVSQTAIETPDEHITIISVSHHREDNQFLITILTEIQNDFYKLSDPQLISTPNQNPNGLVFDIGYDDEIGNACINDDQQAAQCCYQTLWIASYDTQCPLSLQGSFEIKFTIECNQEATLLDECTQYIEENGDETILEVALTHRDTICDPQTFNVGSTWVHEMRFFKDSAFEDEMGDDELYSPADVCYAQITIQHPSIPYHVSTIGLQNVWLCSVPPLNDDIFSYESQGCFGDSVDNDGPLWIIKNHGNGVSMLEATIISETDHDSPASTVIKYSFVVPPIHRDTLYIHNQLTIEIGEETMISMIFGHTKVVWNSFLPYEYKYHKTKITFLRNGQRWMVIIGVLTAVLMIMMLVLMISTKIIVVVDPSKEMDDTYDGERLLKRKKKIAISNEPLSEQCEDVSDEEEDSEYFDFENNRKDPLDDSY